LITAGRSVLMVSGFVTDDNTQPVLPFMIKANA
jgi:hypothetical protein